MAVATSKKQRNRPNKLSSDAKEDEIPVVAADAVVATSDTGTGKKNLPWLVVAVLFAVLAWQLNRISSSIEGSTDDGDMSTKLSRLNAAFPVGGKVKAVEINNTAEIITLQKIQKGEIIMKIEPWHMLPNEEFKKETWYLPLVVRLTEARSSLQLSNNYSNNEIPSVDELFTATVLLMELYKGKKSHWHTYFETLPRNVSQMAFYWSEQERKCFVPRMNGQLAPKSKKIKLRNFHAIFDPVWMEVALSMGITNPVSRTETEFAYLTILTRAFGERLIPMFDILPHDPTKSATIFTEEGTSYVVATRNHEAGEQVFISYNKMTPSDMAESYGFVDPNSAYVNAPSIARDLQSSPETRDLNLCTNYEMIFFGNVPEGRVEAKLGKLIQSIYFKPFHPTQLVYQCVRVLIQSEDGAEIGKYIAEKLEEDINVYEAMANDNHCQSDSGNYPIIRQVNTVTANLLRGALEVAQKAARGEIEYPNMEYP